MGLMMGDKNLKERIAEMKRRAADALHGEFCGIINECQAPVIVDITTRHFIAEIERLEKANEVLDEDNECLRTESDNLRAELGGVYARELRQPSIANMGNDYDDLKSGLRSRFDAATTLDGKVIILPQLIEWGFSLYMKGYLDACELKDVDPRLTRSENKEQVQ